MCVDGEGVLEETKHLLCPVGFPGWLAVLQSPSPPPRKPVRPYHEKKLAGVLTVRGKGDIVMVGGASRTVWCSLFFLYTPVAFHPIVSRCIGPSGPVRIETEDGKEVNV